MTLDDLAARIYTLENENERLRAKLEQLRAALQELDDRYGQNQYFGIGRSIIRAALSSHQ